jgi:hypothetical protein
LMAKIQSYRLEKGRLFFRSLYRLVLWYSRLQQKKKSPNLGI